MKSTESNTYSDPSQAASGQHETWWNRPSGGREVLTLAFPLIISSLSWTVLTFIDRIFLFRYSEEALAASFPAALLWWTSISVAIGTCMYVQTFVAQYLGSDQPSKIGPIVWQGVWVAVILSPIALILIPLTPIIFGLAGHSPEVINQEILYFNYLSIGTPAILVSHALAGFFAGRGKTAIIMVVDASAAVLNIGLDYWWIFGGWGLPAGGIVGAAWATTVSFYAKIVVFGWLFLSRRNRQFFGTQHFQFRWDPFARLVRFGGPSGVQFLLEAGGFTAFVLLVGGLGQTELAATNLAFNVSSFAFMPIFGFGAAVSILVGQRLGANQVQMADRAVWTSTQIAISYMAILSLGYVLTPDLFLVGIDRANSAERPAARELAIILLRYVAAYNIFDALNIIFVSAIKGAGDTRFVMLASILMGGLLTGVTWFGIRHFDFGLHGCWTWVTLWVCLLGIVYCCRYLQGNWKQMRVIESPTEAAEPQVHYSS